MMHRTSHLGKDLSDPKCQYAMVKKPCFRVWCFEWIRSLTMAYYSILSSKENCPYFMNGRVCKIGRCLKIVLLSNDNLFPFLNHTCSKDNPPPLFFNPGGSFHVICSEIRGVLCGWSRMWVKKKREMMKRNLLNWRNYTARGLSSWLMRGIHILFPSLFQTAGLTCISQMPTFLLLRRSWRRMVGLGRG